MCCWVLDNEALVTLDTLEDGRLLDSPFPNVRPFLGSLGVFLFRMGWGPP